MAFDINVRDNERSNTIERFAQSELRRMGMDYSSLALIRDKGGVSVWRVNTDSGSVVMKCFDKPEYRREIANYQLLDSLGIPTLKLIAHTECSFIMEDIEKSKYRLATMGDVRAPKLAVKIAQWYTTLHRNGREYASTHSMFEECDMITVENINRIKVKTGAGKLPVWTLVEEHDIFEDFSNVSNGKSAVMISHRLSSITLCDKILVLEDGHIIEQGSHDELLQDGGKYAHLFNLQASKYI